MAYVSDGEGGGYYVTEDGKIIAGVSPDFDPNNAWGKMVLENHPSNQSGDGTPSNQLNYSLQNQTVSSAEVPEYLRSQIPDWQSYGVTYKDVGGTPTVNSIYKKDSSWLDGVKGFATDFVLPAVGAYFGAQALGGLGGASSAAGTEGLSSLPAGGMSATGTTAPWAASGDAALGSGLYGTGDAAIGNVMGTTQGAFGWGTGLSGVSAGDLAAAGGSTDWISNAQKLGKLLKPSAQPAGAPAAGGTTGGGLGGLNTSSNMSQPQGMELVPKFSAAPPGQADYFGELGNSQKINQLAQALMSYKGSING